MLSVMPPDMIDRARTFADGATFAQIAAVEGVSQSAVRAGILRFIARARASAAAYRDQEAVEAMRSGNQRQRARAAIVFRLDRQPVHDQERRDAWAAGEAQRQADWDINFVEFLRAIEEE